MASSSGNSAGSPPVHDDDRLDQRKRKRMQSNRESARRSRMRKQKHLDDLTAQIAQLKKENNQISTSVSVTTQHYVNIEAENSILRAQMNELSHRLQSLNEILNYINSAAVPGGAAAGSCLFEAEESQHQGLGDNFMNNSWNSMGYSQYPIMAAAEMFDY